MDILQDAMLKRVVTKIGDVFSVQISDTHKKHFQLIAFDLLQLNSDVIRAFRHVYPTDAQPSLEEIVDGEVEFYAHCVTKAGVKMDLWKKIGRSDNVGRLDQIIFKGTNDAGSKPGEQTAVSDNWYV